MTKDKGGENMPMNSYQYGTSPRKYEPEYTPKRKSKTSTTKSNRKCNERSDGSTKNGSRKTSTK